MTNPQAGHGPRRIIVAINPAAAFGTSQGVGEKVAAEIARAGHTVVQLRQANYELLRREVHSAVNGGNPGGARDSSDTAISNTELDRSKPSRRGGLEPTNTGATTTGDNVPDALVVVGGDGMVSLGINAVAHGRVPLGIIPAGSGNDSARYLGLPLGDPSGAVQVLLEAMEREPRMVDVGVVECEGRRNYFFGSLSAGFDAAVNERANHMRWPNNGRKYTIAVVRELLTFHAPDYQLTVDGTLRRRRAMLVAVANHSFIGGGMNIVPEARIDDGQLDLFIVDRMSRFQFLKLFPKVFRGEHVGESPVHLEKVKRVSIQARRISAYADGERVGFLPVEVSISPGAVKLLA